MLATDLSDEQRDEFTELFYNLKDSPDDAFCENACPSGCPWYHGYKIELRGRTVKEMVLNYAEDFKEEFI